MVHFQLHSSHRSPLGGAYTNAFLILEYLKVMLTVLVISTLKAQEVQVLPLQRSTHIFLYRLM